MIKFLIISVNVFLISLFCLAQSVSGPTLSPPVSKLLSGYQGYYDPNVVATIAASGTTSTPIWLKGFELTGIVIPATFTGTAITFQASLDGVNYYTLKNTYSGAAVSYTVTTSSFYAIAPADFAGVNYIKIVSGSTEGSTRTLNLATRGL